MHATKPSELNSLQEPDFTLATLTFDTLTEVTNSPITLFADAIGDAYGNPIAADLQNGSITVTSSSAAPEPASIALTCLGVLIIGRR